MTKATIGEGTITIRDKDKQKQDAAMINREAGSTQIITKEEKAGVEVHLSSDALQELATGFKGIRENIEKIADKNFTSSAAIPDDVSNAVGKGDIGGLDLAYAVMQMLLDPSGLGDEFSGTIKSTASICAKSDACVEQSRDIMDRWEAKLSENPDLAQYAQIKGERGFSGSPNGTDNPFKHLRPHPTDPTKVIYIHPQTGKKIVKPMPPGFPGGNKD
ncbi:hypothetical protein [Microvirga lotononidis]|uniref:hypothetical protein n=1 Tax=Microvirga lotononidis TaxID=864069 RepID=UPI0012B5FE2B|nr:hypothetical protein [Microvirga lotononidis]WQO28948.1 hypothetical protein U0023_07710 [Microvirga lotononidis]